jgi:hypothetical protein
LEVNPEFRPVLKAAGLLKRDPRSVERKKFGHKKARKSFQFSKRQLVLDTTNFIIQTIYTNTMENNTSLQQQLLDAGVHCGHLK